MAKQPKQLGFSFPVSPSSKRYKQAERMVERGKAPNVSDALHAIYQKEYKARDEKARQDGLKNYYTSRKAKETTGTYKQLMEKVKQTGDKKEISELWRIFRIQYQAAKQ